MTCALNGSIIPPDYYLLHNNNYSRRPMKKVLMLTLIALSVSMYAMQDEANIKEIILQNLDSEKAYNFVKGNPNHEDSKRLERYANFIIYQVKNDPNNPKTKNLSLKEKVEFIENRPSHPSGTIHFIMTGQQSTNTAETDTNKALEDCFEILAQKLHRAYPSNYSEE